MISSSRNKFPSDPITLRMIHQKILNFLIHNNVPNFFSLNKKRAAHCSSYIKIFSHDHIEQISKNAMTWIPQLRKLCRNGKFGFVCMCVFVERLLTKQTAWNFYCGVDFHENYDGILCSSKGFMFWDMISTHLVVD